jgi:plasmid rolling circle replication initiator protein Rep
MSRNYKPLKFRKTAERVYNHVDRAYYQREKAETVADALHAAAEANPAHKNYDENLVHADRIKYCSEKVNYYTANDLNTSDGECYNGFSHLSACSSKLCIACNALASKRNKKTAAAAIAGTELVRRTYRDYEDGGKVKIQQEQLRFITLTMPPLQDSCLYTLDILADAWERFRKTDFLKNYVSGFVRGSEFTTRKDGTYHSHIHLLAASVFIPEELIKKFWTKCVETAFQNAGIYFEPGTGSGFCVVNLRFVSSVDAALKEICKYITKAESWSEVPPEHLLEIAAVKRWPKMFSLGGKFGATSERLKQEAAAITTATAAGVERESYLDTTSVSDGFTKEELLEIAEAEAALLKRKKKPNWRTLVRELGRERYLIVHAAQVSKQRQYRKRQLIEKYPLATFTDLNGVCWYSPELGFVEEFSVVTCETLVWNAPKPPQLEEMGFDEERARAEYPEEFEYILEEPEYFADYMPEHFEEPEYFEFKIVPEMEHAVTVAKPIIKPVVAVEYSEFDEFGW